MNKVAGAAMNSSSAPADTAWHSFVCQEPVLAAAVAAACLSIVIGNLSGIMGGCSWVCGGRQRK